MKLVASSTANSPAERMRRDRASAATLRAAFPNVELLRLELSFRAAANAPTAQSHLLHPPARAFFRFPCPYADCDGQFDLASAVQAALADPAHQTQGRLECAGTRNHSDSRRPCQLQLDYTVTATCAAAP